MGTIAIAIVVCGLIATVAVVAAVQYAVKHNAIPQIPTKREKLLLPDSTVPKTSSITTRETNWFTMHKFALGDVVDFHGSDPAWLTSAVQVRDGEEDEAGLFFSDGSKHHQAIVLRASAMIPPFVMHAVSVPDMAFLPFTLQNEHELFTRDRLIPVTLRHHGYSHPCVGKEGKWAWYTAASGDSLCCLHTEKGTLAWRGHAIDAYTLHIPASKTSSFT